MSKFDNIEEIFRNSLENFEADVDPAVWENVSSQIGGQVSAPDASSSGASASGSSAFVGSVAVKSIVVLGTAGLLTLGAYYLIKPDSTDAISETKEISSDIEQVDEAIGTGAEKDESQEASSNNHPNTISASTEKPISVEIEKKEVNTPKTDAIAYEDAKATIQPVKQVEKEIVPVVTAEKNTVEKNEVKKETAVAPVTLPKLLARIYASEKSGKKPLQVKFENRGTQATYIRWKIAGEPMYSQETVIDHTFENSGKYWVVVEIKDEAGQKSRDSIEILVEGNGHLNIPNVFTPNGDGVNDNFVVDTEDMKSLRCIIVDRSGNVIYKWDGVDGHWDGRDMHGRDAQPDSYFYVIEAVDQDGMKYNKKGMVTLYRN